jgi:thiazole synthase ThiGH ThiG subunit
VLKNLVLLNVDLDCVVHLDQGIGVADGATIVCDNVGHALLANSNIAHAAKLELWVICCCVKEIYTNG